MSLGAIRADAVLARVKRRLAALGVTGGWVWVNEPVIRQLPDPDMRPEGTGDLRLQGWWAVAHWAATHANALREPNLTEIRDGTRIGTPTLDASRVREFALALVAPGRVCLRVGDRAFDLI